MADGTSFLPVPRQKMKSTKRYRNPIPTVDIIIEISSPVKRQGIVLIKRKNPPLGWALPGGFVDYNESLEQAAVREAEEETSLKVKLLFQFHTYSDTNRDPRQHTITTVYVALARTRAYNLVVNSYPL